MMGYIVATSITVTRHMTNLYITGQAPSLPLQKAINRRLAPSAIAMQISSLLHCSYKVPSKARVPPPYTPTASNDRKYDDESRNYKKDSRGIVSRDRRLDGMEHEQLFNIPKRRTEVSVGAGDRRRHLVNAGAEGAETKYERDSGGKERSGVVLCGREV